MEHTGVIKSMKDFYWDIRPKPEFGTIELRVCDTPLTVERAAALAAYLQALCSYLLERREEAPAEDDYLVYNYNRFQACRFGLDGTLVHPKTYESLSLREDILTTLRKMEPYGAALGGSEGLQHLVRASHEGSDAHYLRQQFDRSGSAEGMVDAAIQRFRGRDRSSGGELRHPCGNGSLRIATMEALAPWIGAVARAVLQLDIDGVADELGRSAGHHSVGLDGAVDRAVGADQRAGLDGHAWQDDRHRGDGDVVLDSHAHHGFTWRMRIVGQHDIREDPDIVADRGVLADVDIAVEFDVLADGAMALDVAQRADLETIASLGFLADCHAVARAQVVAEFRTFVEHAVRPDQGRLADNERCATGQGGRHADLAVGTDLRIVSDDDVSVDDSARCLERGHRRRAVGQPVRVEPAAVDAVAVGAQDVGVEPVADDDGFAPVERLCHVGGVLEKAHVGFRIAAGFRRGHERNRILQAGAGNAQVLDVLDAIGDDADLADGGQLRAQLSGAVDQHHRVGQRGHVNIAGLLGIEVELVRQEGHAEALDLEEILGDFAQFQAAPQRHVNRLVLAEQALGQFVQAQYLHGVQKRELFGSLEIEQGIVEVKQKQPGRAAVRRRHDGTGRSIVAAGGQRHDGRAGRHDQRIFDQAAAGLADAGHGLLAAGQRDVRQRHGRGDSHGGAGLLAALGRQCGAGNARAHHARQQAQKHGAVRRGFHLVAIQLADAHGQRAVFDDGVIEQIQVAGRLAARQARGGDGGHGGHGAGAGNGADQNGREQAADGHVIDSCVGCVDGWESGKGKRSGMGASLALVSARVPCKSIARSPSNCGERTQAGSGARLGHAGRCRAMARAIGRYRHYRALSGVVGARPAQRRGPSSFSPDTFFLELCQKPYRCAGSRGRQEHRAVAGQGLQGVAGIHRPGAGTDDGRGGKQPAVPAVAQCAGPGVPCDCAVGLAHAGAAHPARAGGGNQRGGVDRCARRQQRGVCGTAAGGTDPARHRRAHRQPRGGVFERGRAGDPGLAAAPDAAAGAAGPAAGEVDGHDDYRRRCTAGKAGADPRSRLRGVEPGNRGGRVRDGGARARYRRHAGGVPERRGAGAPQHAGAVRSEHGGRRAGGGAAAVEVAAGHGRLRRPGPQDCQRVHGGRAQPAGRGGGRADGVGIYRRQVHHRHRAGGVRVGHGGIVGSAERGHRLPAVRAGAGAQVVQHGRVHDLGRDLPALRPVDADGRVADHDLCAAAGQRGQLHQRRGRDCHRAAHQLAAGRVRDCRGEHVLFCVWRHEKPGVRDLVAQRDQVPRGAGGAVRGACAHRWHRADGGGAAGILFHVGWRHRRADHCGVFHRKYRGDIFDAVHHPGDLVDPERQCGAPRDVYRGLAGGTDRHCAGSDRRGGAVSVSAHGQLVCAADVFAEHECLYGRVCDGVAGGGDFCRCEHRCAGHRLAGGARFLRAAVPADARARVSRHAMDGAGDRPGAAGVRVFRARPDASVVFYTGLAPVDFGGGGDGHVSALLRQQPRGHLRAAGGNAHHHGLVPAGQSLGYRQYVYCAGDTSDRDSGRAGVRPGRRRQTIGAAYFCRLATHLEMM
uniref:Glutamate--cysteine ligase n=1 Tax=Tanacetum cinerariifolium TaxID=118510 RepID=A0A699GF57_TANCI|nr:hypothetical protein [Tanacetum cinerariifolium]